MLTLSNTAWLKKDWLNFVSLYFQNCRSQWPRSLRRMSAAARLLRSWVRILPWAWIFVCCECCVLSGRGLCDELITRREESYRLCCVVVCDLETSRMRRPWLALGRSATEKKIKIRFSDQYDVNYIIDVFWINLYLNDGLGRVRKEDLALQFWTPRSPDLTPCDIFLWGFVKEAVYPFKPWIKSHLLFAGIISSPFSPR